MEDDPARRTLLQRLTVFPAGWDLPAAEAVCCGEGVQASELALLVDQLCAASLLVVDGSAGERRFRLAGELPADIAHAAQDWLPQGRRRHALYYLGLAERLEPELWAPTLVAALDRLERDHENLRAALRWAIANREAAVALRFGAALWRFWEVRGYLAEGSALLNQALAIEQAVAPDVLARALDAAGHLARAQGDFQRATPFYVRALRGRLKLGDTRGAALALNNLAVVAQFGGNPSASLAHQEASTDLFRELGDASGMALSLLTFGVMTQLQSRLAEARDLYEQSLALFTELGDAHGIAAALNNLGNTAVDAGDPAAARERYLGALRLFRQLGEKTEEAACLHNLALVEQQVGAVEEAARYCGQSLALYDELADGRGVATCLVSLSRLALARDDPSHAARLVGAAQVLRETLGIAAAPVADPALQQTAAQLEALLGPARFSTLAAEGRMIPLAEVIAAAQLPGSGS